MADETAPVSEHLVIITDTDREDSLRRLLERHVAQRVSNRVFLIRGSTAGADLPKRGGFHIFSSPDVPEEVLNSLDEREALFVAAWQTRLRQPSKSRPGDGLDWDHPGFKPPR